MPDNAGHGRTTGDAGKPMSLTPTNARPRRKTAHYGQVRRLTRPFIKPTCGGKDASLIIGGGSVLGDRRAIISGAITISLHSRSPHAASGAGAPTCGMSQIVGIYGKAAVGTVSSSSGMPETSSSVSLPGV